MIFNLLKAATATALLPITAAVDVVMIPSDAHDGENFAPRTRDMADTVAKNIKAALEPEKDKP